MWEARELAAKLQEWVDQLLPEALGSLLGTMIARPKALHVRSVNVDLSPKQVHALQQLTIARLLGWLNRRDYSAQQRNRHKLTEAVVRMH